MEEPAMRRVLLLVACCMLLAELVPASDAIAQCIYCREHLTGDFLGVRSGLAEHGVVADLQLTQFYQDVATGGADEADAYGGKLDYFSLLQRARSSCMPKPALTRT